MSRAEIGIFGGTGLYSVLEDFEEIKVETPYGSPSDLIALGRLGGRQVAFLPRHGRKHTVPPHLINYRANVWAFKELGVTRVISPSAVGSLAESVEPGHFVVPDQYIDMTRSRKATFMADPADPVRAPKGELGQEGKVWHVSMAEPFCPQLRGLIAKNAADLGLRCHDGGTYVCIEGPRFSTRAESRLFRSWNAQIIGMTLVPECNLAREARMCYSSVSSVTDYDAWTDEHVTAGEVVRTLRENSDKTRALLESLVSGMPEERRCACASAMDDAQF